MSDRVVVLGAGYAGAGAVKRVEAEVGGSVDLTWISEHDYHLVLHEVHRAIRDPAVEESVTLPVESIKSPTTDFVEGRVTDVDVESRTVGLEDGRTVDYDYLLVALGSSTAFYGIEGLREHSLTLKSLADAKAIHEEISGAAAAATPDDPTRVVVGGAGLSGIQSAGEVAEFRDEHHAPIEITLVEGLDEVFPGNDPSVQAALRARLQELGIEILTGDFISKVDTETIYVGGDEDAPPSELDYDVLVWTGGITGRRELHDVAVDKDERSDRLFAASDFQTSDERVFAIGDTALVEQGPDAVAPPTAQAAWQAAEVAGRNLAHAVRGEPLETWRHENRGTVVSVGDAAVAHDVAGLPIDTFDGYPAKFLKKAIASKWIADVTTVSNALRAWSDM